MLFAQFLWVALGGALGATLRYGVGVMMGTMSLSSRFPWGTLSINLLGSFVMGMAIAAILRLSLPPALADSLRAFLIIGVLGGFTTFSAISFEIFSFIERRDYIFAFTYGGATLVLGVVSFALGFSLLRSLL